MRRLHLRGGGGEGRKIVESFLLTGERYIGVLFHKFCYNCGEKCSSFLWDFVIYKGFFLLFTGNFLYRGSSCGSFVSQGFVLPGFRNIGGSLDKKWVIRG